jgi:hypothetical protein
MLKRLTSGAHRVSLCGTFVGERGLTEGAAQHVVRLAQAIATAEKVLV